MNKTSVFARSMTRAFLLALGVVVTLAAEDLRAGERTTSALTEADCLANNGAFLRGAVCVASCEATDGLRGSTCVTSGQTGTECQANGGRLLRNSGCVSTCEADDGLRNSHTCVTSNANAGDCTANNAVLNGTSGTTCISRTSCTGMTEGNRYINSDDNTCVATCAAGEGVADNDCVSVTSLNAGERTTACLAAGREVVGMMCGVGADAIIEAFRGAGNTAEISALASVSGITDRSSTTDKRRLEYANQPSLDIVGAAFAYGKAGDGALSIDAAIAKAGAGSQISVITNRRFDSNHPEFSSSSSDATFDTLTGFRVDTRGVDKRPRTLAAVIPAVFGTGEEAKARVQLYGYSRAVVAYATIQVPNFMPNVGSVTFENISRNAFDADDATGTAIRTALETFLQSVVDGTEVDETNSYKITKSLNGRYRFSFNGVTDGYIELTATELDTGGVKDSQNFNHVGRVYTDDGNIGSYQIVMGRFYESRDDSHSGECVVDNACYSGFVPAVASGAEMGILALINGLMNPDATGVAYNTHGIAPGAKLDVITTPVIGAEGANIADAIYRARGIDVGRDVSGNTIGADDNRNIVIIQNGIAESGVTGAVTSSDVNTITGSSGSYRFIYRALQVGLAEVGHAKEVKQDAYVFAAADGRAADSDVGILAALPISDNGDTIAPYSIIVVAAESGQTPCGANTDVQAICIAAPGEYKYRDRIDDVDNGTYRYADTLSTATSANAAASLVAGGLALLESIFSGETTARLIDRLLKTASKNYDFDRDGSNDYTDASKHGQGLMDLACAIKPGLSATLSRTGCVDRGSKCLAQGQGVDGSGNCVGTTITTVQCGRAGGILMSDTDCVSRRDCTESRSRFVNLADTHCVANCDPGEAPGIDGAGKPTLRCAVAATACSGTAGYDSTNRVCVPMVTVTAPQCAAVSKVLLRAVGGGCAAMCAATDGLNAATSVCTSSPTGVQCQANNNARLRDSGCVASCMDADGYNSTTFTCVTSGQTGTECQANGGRLLRNSGCVSTCEDDDGLRNSHTCVTSNATADECTANNALLNAGQRTCISRTGCTGMSNGNRYINSDDNTCVAMCASGEGRSADGECIASSSVSAADCNRGGQVLTTSGGCADACDAAEGLNTGTFTCTASGLNGTLCDANGGRVYNSNTSACETAMTCTARSGGSAHRFISNMQCVNSCPANQGVNNGECTSTALTGQFCLDAGRVLRSSNCVDSCAAAEGLRAGACVTSGLDGAACDANGSRVYNSNTSACETVMTCTARTGGSDYRFISAMQCVNSCPANQGVNNGECTSTALTGQFCLDAGRVLRSSNCVDSCAAVEGLRAGACVTSGLTGAECDANGGRVFNSGAGNCETAMACTARTGGSAYRFISNMQCVNSCPANEGVNASDECVSTALTGQFCLNAGRVLSGGNCVSGCAAAEGLRAGACVTTVTSAAECTANGALLRMGGTTCITRTGCTSMTAGIRYINVAETTCVSECAAGQGLTNADLCTAMPDADACGRVTRVLLSSNTCGAAGDCAAGQGVQDDACTAYASLRDKDAGCSLAGRVDGGRACSVPVSSNEIIEAFRGAGNTAETSDLIDSSGFDGDSTTAQKRQAEYANQPSLDIVGAAFAYGKAGAGAVDINAAIAKAGAGSNISVITTKRFDPTHPEFSSSANNAKFDTLTRFLVDALRVDTPPTTLAVFIPAVFDTDEAKARVQLYSDGFRSGFWASATIQVPNAGSVTFESISRDAFNGNSAVRTALETFLKGVVDGTLVDKSGSHKLTKSGNGRYYFSFNGDTNGHIPLTNYDGAFDFHHVGRVYTDGGNIGSYQIVIDTNWTVRDYTDSGECVVDNDCYTRFGYVPVSASGAEMGILALINGLANPAATGVAYNTHGIAPGATLDVFTTPFAGLGARNGADTIYRARGIDVVRDSGADKDRNIVIINNNMAASAATDAVTSSAVNALTTGSGVYKTMYETMQVGLADNDEQDAYVFAAADGRSNDVGILAALPISTRGTSISDYSIIVVAAEKDQTPCGSLSAVQAICIAAPGEYKYRDRHSTTGVYETTLSTATSANAAASLVAGGLALLESIFSGETTARLIDRLLMTASKDYDLNNDYTNDYTAQKHGQGLMDLACAIRPVFSTGDLARTGCTDRFATSEAVSVSSNDIIEVFRGAGNTAETSALASVSGIKDRSSTADKRRLEYANQRSLDVVGAAFAYGKAGDGTATGIDDAIAKAGAGSNISVITSKRFDPTHPEFSSAANNATFDTLTRFYVSASGVDTPPTTLAAMIPAVFDTDEAKVRVEMHSHGFNSRGYGRATIRVPNVGSVTFESISRNAFDAHTTTGAAIRTALETFLQRVVDGTQVHKTNSHKLSLSIYGGYYFSFNSGTDGFIELTGATGSFNFDHVGRVYTDGGNIGSYQIVMRSGTEVRDDSDSAECVVDNACYDSAVPAAASGAEMGILALINGLANPAATGVAYNTHGIAPGATLDVITAPAVGATGHIGADTIYRARGIDVARDSGADKDRNIVIINNNMADSSLDGNLVGDYVTTHTATGASYGALYETLQIGLANNAKQDAYVFAARDGGAADVGLLAALPISSRGTSIAPYSIIVVAAEVGQTPCGSGSNVQPICIAAPGTYQYRDRNYDGTYAKTLSTATSANAAASLVAGGLALLESIFSGETTARLIDRLLKTASKDYDLNNDGTNDYTGYRHGQGLMDLACAIRPVFSTGDLDRTGCVDRFATGFGVSSDDIIEAFRGAGKTAEDSALIDSSTFTDGSSTADKRRREYANQPSLDIVGAAFAYGKAGNSAVDIDAAIAKAGAGSNISVITNRRFDPNHPEFSSSASDATFDTLTRFLVSAEGVATPPTTLAAMIPAVFDTDEAKARVQLYSDGFDSRGFGFATIRVPNLGSVTFESISHSAFDVSGNGAVRTAMETFLKSVVDGTHVDKSGSYKLTTSIYGKYHFSFSGRIDGFIILTNGSSDRYNFNHVGRVYTDGGNIGSYQIVIDTNDETRDYTDSGECVVDNDCYVFGIPVEAASGAEMGILALINGMMNPDATGVAYNTHGIAPGARLDVFTAPAVGVDEHTGADTIYRARGIDVARDVSSGNIIADDNRNIVIINNNMAASTATGAVTSSAVNTITTGGRRGDYKTMYKTLQVGLANTNKQDAYVFAARDGGAADVGLLAALPISTHGTSISDYSIIVVAAEGGQTPCGANTDVQAICIAAPGEYKYRDRDSTTGVYATTLSTATSANAAASLVAGGLALLESIFSGETTARLIDRLLKTASKNFNLDDDKTNDYTAARHGQGLMDLACAIKPGLSVTLSRTGCVDRLAVTAAECNQGGQVLTTSGGCADMCGAAEGLNAGTHTCTASGLNGTLCDANGGRVYNSNTSACETAMTCTDRTGGSAHRFISAMQCVNSCPANQGVNNGECTSTALTGQFCLDAGRVLSGSNCVAGCATAEGLRAGVCVTGGLDVAACDANGGRVYNSNTSACETAMACTARSGGSDFRFISNMQCVNSCPANQGVNASDECTSTALTGQFCLDAGRVLSGSNCVDSCATAEGLRAGVCVTSALTENDCVVKGSLLRGNVCAGDCEATDGIRGDICIITGATGPECQANSAFKRGNGACVAMCEAADGLRNSHTCVASGVTAGDCVANGLLLNSGLGTCIARSDCIGMSGGNQYVNVSATTCVAACGAGEGIVDKDCVSVARLTDSERTAACLAADREVVGMMCGVRADEIIEAFRGAGNTAETSDLIDSSGFDDDSTTAQKRQVEYANQPSLDVVGAAFAYGKAGAGAVGIDAAIAKAGAGSNISVVTSKRFDPNHPEFSSSSDDATFDTLTRFYVYTRGVDTPPTTLAAVIPAVFDTDEAKARVQLYRDGFDSGGSALATIQVPNVGSVTFERISRDAFDASGNGVVRRALETFLQSVVDGTQVDKTNWHKLTSFYDGEYDFSFNGDDRDAYIQLTSSGDSENFNHVGRVYTDGGNIGSYQIVIDTSDEVRDDSDSGECVVDNDCYDRFIADAASGAEMGILALINGLMNPDATGVAYNTHGIAPGARLDVFATPAAGAFAHIGADTIYRARGIDVARDSGADKDRNIVIINNNMAASAATGAVTQENVNTITTSGGAYVSMYRALQVGLADNAKQDAYVFAAQDRRRNDVGLLAALPISSHGTSISDYSIIVVAAEKDQTPCGANTDVQAICIAAPGTYQYRARNNDGTYATTLSAATSANAAASLVAGGLALLESIFSGETTARLIDRLLKTASKDYDLNNDYTNDYTAQKHGQGLMDLACAIRPTLNSGPLARTGCTDRFATPEAVPVSSNEIIEAFRGAGNTAETSALASVSGINDRSSTADKRRLEYANQPGLDIVGAAFAYGKAGEGTATGIDAAIAKAGAGSNISVITNRRFDPTHPEFSSSANNATFDTLTRFYVYAADVATPPTTLAAMIPAVFGTGDEAKVRVQLYSNGFDSGGVGFATIRVPNLGSVTFESISRADLNRSFNARSSAVRAALATFLKRVVDGTQVDKTNSHKLSSHTRNYSSDYYFSFNGDRDGYIELTRGTFVQDFNHVGRVYTDGGNIASYQIVIGTGSGGIVHDYYASGECVVDNACYYLGVPKAASGAEMGILALINGLANPTATGVAYNTHGIAPGATLDVFTAPAVGVTADTGADTIYRARGIDVARDSGADKDRNIVIINNNMAASAATGAVTQENVNTITTSGGAYVSMYRALQVGLADTAKQDAYVFAAQDRRRNDVGLLAALPISTHGTSISDYSIIVVAAEKDQTPCGSNTNVQAICIAAPGTYQYRARNNDGTYATTLSTATSANAAASLVAGGLALLESIFSGETTARLIDRLLMTASKDYDLNNDDTNDYTAAKHGQGLMDLACAIRPTLNSGPLARTGCTDRFATPEAVPVPVSSNEIIEAFRGAGKTAETSVLASVSGITDSSSTADKRRREYANQPSLDVVGAAFAYGKAGAGAVGIDAAIAKAGAESNISVVTSKRFDPNHPEFSSAANNATFDTLTRFYVQALGVDSPPTTLAAFISAVFGTGDEAKARVQLYSDGFGRTDTSYATIQVPNLGSVTFERISRNAFDASGNGDVRTALETFLKSVVDGTLVDKTNSHKLTKGRGRYRFSFSGGTDGYIPLTSAVLDWGNFNHVGRVYTDGGNIGSYQIVIDTSDKVRDDDDSGECIVDEACYGSAVPEVAIGREMAILALINGLANPSATGVAYNTHGIAPGATLDVVTTPAIAATGENIVDAIYRARGIDVALDSGADKDRNIVIIQNNLAASTATGDAAPSIVDGITTNPSATNHGTYRFIYRALQVGLADNDKQDAYVFAARDGGTNNDVGLLAALPTSTHGASISDYSIIVVAAEDGQTPCGITSVVQSICIAAPGKFMFRPSSGGVYQDRLAEHTSANAAASLVAGGLALLESIFSGETTARLIDRLLMTASKDYDLDTDGSNDYTAREHGQGLMDLACAIKPGLSATLSRTGCVDRFANGFGVPSNEIIEVFRGAGNGAEDSALIDSSGFTDRSSTAQKRQREYANQRSLDVVGAAFAYGKAGAGAPGIDAAIAKAGAGSNISVVTSKRFDPTHPEFSSAANDAKFDTLTRFHMDAQRVGTPPTTPAAFIPAVFDTDEAKARVQLYSDGFDSRGFGFATIRVPNLGSATFESISRGDVEANGNGAVRTALETFLQRVVDGTQVDKTNWHKLTMHGGRYYFSFNGNRVGFITLTSGIGSYNSNHVGRVYTDGGNIGSYQIVVDRYLLTRDYSDSGECVVDNDCYRSFAPAAASGAEMGILALINGLANPSATGVAYNTHGIAPGATLNVFTALAAGARWHNGVDAIYRARGIDVARDSGADKDRNIVIINNNMADSSLDGNLVGDYVTTHTATGASYGPIYEALQRGLANNAKQDAYIFAARDGGATDDVGLLAALPISSRGTSIAPYSIIVVTAEKGQTPCGSGSSVQPICIAAPGTYKYRDRNYDGTYATTLSTATSANAAASLVAGGLALLESIFPTETTARLIDRLLGTASKKFNLDDPTGVNQYTIYKHGQGLMDLACAIRPTLRSGPLARTGCTDRFATHEAVPVSSNEIIEAFRGNGNTADGSTLADTSSITDSNNTRAKRRLEYANQPSLDMVGAAFAYGKAGAGAVGIDAAIAKAGAGSQISVVTSKRFDPTHPEFSSSANNAKFDTLTRFYVHAEGVDTPPTTLAAVIPAVFDTDEAKARVQLYDDGFSNSGNAYATIQVPNLGSVTFESISRNAFDRNGAVRRALETFLKSVVDGTLVDKTDRHKLTGSYYFSFNGYWDGFIALTENHLGGLNFDHVGRVYIDGGNIGSYQIVIDNRYEARDYSDSGECVVHNGCYDFGVPKVASGAEMGILALINGLANPSATGVAYNTHGIAPGATLNVFTTPAALPAAADTIYRARGIDVARDSGADKDRNIVIINNNMAVSTATGAVTPSSVNTITTSGGAYVSIYETLQVGLADNAKQDAYVFAARDGGATDVGLLAALPISTHGTSISDYSIIVVAVEKDQTPCGAVAAVQAICIAAPGEYKYRDRHSTTGVYATTLSTATSANAAASLVAGGLALLESIFSGETTARLIDRLLKTASKDYDLNNDDTNDYTAAKHGQGLMDLACAIKPGLSATLRRASCVDRFSNTNEIIEAFRGAGNTAKTSALANVSGITDRSNTAGKRRREYANQPSLDIVGAAFAYSKVGEGEADIDAAIAKIAKVDAGSKISVITSKRFDPNHPEFSSAANDATFDTLTRFYVDALNLDTPPTTLAAVIPAVFGTGDEAKARVQLYSDGFDSRGIALATIRVPNLGSVTFENISRDAFDADTTTGAAIRTALETFLKSVVDGTQVDKTNSYKLTTSHDGGYRFSFNSPNGDILLTGIIDWTSFNHLGRVYTDGGNIGSYQLVIDTNWTVRSDGDSGECVVDNDCYARFGYVPAAASGAEMGILALINGLMNPDATGVAYNTHGIAPGARLDVFTTPAVGATGENIVDTIYRARGIDIARDSGADKDRNIVIINNNMASSRRIATGAVTQANVNTITTSGGAYVSIYETLQVGLADTTKQDAYVFAAQDGRAADVGLLAALPISTHGTSISDYSIIVVAAEDGQTPCGANTDVQAICIAAPGTYQYRDRNNDGTYATTLSTATSANAAASLVAGGLALLESIFPTEKTTRLIDRLLKTASKDYGLNSVYTNDYTAQKHGQGLMDLACAVKPGLSVTLSRTGCVDRFTTVYSNEIVEVFRGAGNTAETSALASVSGINDRSSTAGKRRLEYANQPSLDVVGAAFAYGKAGAGADDIDAAIAKITKAGAGSNISVVTSKRFDPTHPEFSSSANNAKFDTLTRFFVYTQGVDTPPTTLAAVIPAIFDTDEAKARVQLYSDGFESRGWGYATIRVPNVGSVTFESISYNAFDADTTTGAAIRTALETFLQRVVDGTQVDKSGSHKLTKLPNNSRYLFSFRGDTDGYITLTSGSGPGNFQHVGRVYTDGGNIGSYQIFTDPSSIVRDESDSGECVVDNNCYRTLFFSDLVPAAASGAEMGILALINGLANPAATGVAYNTHGIAPGAKLDVIAVGANGRNGHNGNGADTIYRARGINVGRDSGADKDRNIVIINNNMASSAATGAVTSSAVNALTTGSGAYKIMYEAMQVGLANNAKQDAYVFAAADGRRNDVGILAALPISTHGTSIAPYSIIVVAAEDGQSPCGSLSVVQAICIAAPGEYKYRDRNNDGTYAKTLSTATSANAAASLVAGGLALLESIFSTETTARLIDRLLMTASKDYDLNNDGINDFTAFKHGQGLMDLACAIKPGLSATLSRDGCVDRHASRAA